MIGAVIGYLGEVHPAVAGNYAIKEQGLRCCAGYAGDRIARATFRPQIRGHREISQLATRDLRPWLCRKMCWRVILRSVFRERGGQILRESCMICLISMREHRSKPGYKSIAYSLSFRAKDRNLEDADITRAMDRIVKALEHVGAELRK